MYFVKDENVNVNCLDAVGRTPLLSLCEFNQSDILYECILSLLQLRNSDVQINHQDKWVNTALIYLCANYKGEKILQVVNF